MLDAYGNRLLDFSEGLMQAETLAEAWRPRGLTSVGIGSRFLRGADALVAEGVVGEDMDEITARAMAAVRDWEPYFLMVVYYAADSMGHLFGAESAETLAAIEDIDARVARILNAYADKNLLDETVVVVLADHGMMQVEQSVGDEFLKGFDAVAHGRLAFTPRALSDRAISTLMNLAEVEDVWSQDELELLGAWNPRWGKHIIHLKEGLMFPHAREMLGYHGAWTRTERQVPLILSGAGIRPTARLDTCELVDLAPTLSCLLGGDLPQHAEGRVLWEILDADHPPSIVAHQELVRERDRLLDEFKRLRREFAVREVRREEFAIRQKEWQRAAAANRATLQKASQELRKAEG
jgi:arylsulfatase A-like enzyme